MYVKTPGSPDVIDGVVAVKGSFHFHPGVEKDPNVELELMYVNSKTQQSFGTCPMKAGMFSLKTMEKFRDFLEHAEEDFGNIVFEGGQLSPFGPVSLGGTDSGEGLPKKLGG